MRQELPRKLGLAGAVAVIVGTLIGSGIFIAPILIARSLESGSAILAVWAFTGVVSLFGALAYAELGAMMPATGGQYVFLRESFGPLCAFLCGWTYFLVVSAGAVAWLAISLAGYLTYFVPLTPALSKLAAVALIGLITMVNYRGVVAGAAVQEALTLLKLLGLAILIGAAFVMPGAPPSAAPSGGSGFSLSQFGVAMIACVVAYDGWMGVSFLAGEVKHPRRNLPLALALGLAICVAVYLLANAAYLRVLSIQEMAATERLGSLVAERTLGRIGGAIVTLTILFSIAGSANGIMLAYPRMSFAQARDGLFFRRFGDVHPRFQAPSIAVRAHGVWAAVLALTGTYETLASFAMIAAWLFYGMTAIGVLILRRKYPEFRRPYRMWGYPVTPLLFSAIALAFVINTAVATPVPALAGLTLMAAGIPAYRLWRGRLPTDKLPPAFRAPGRWHDVED
jgi:APA family basic amino acid/polyamine antiporter